MDDILHDTFSTDDAPQSGTRGQHEDLNRYPQGPTMANFQPQPTAAYEDVHPGFNQHPPSAHSFSYQASQTQNTHTTGASSNAYNGGYAYTNHQLLQPPFLGNTFNDPSSDFGWLPSTTPAVNPYAAPYGVPDMSNQMYQDMSAYTTNMFFSQDGFGTMPSHLEVPALSDVDAFSGLDTSGNSLHLRLQPQSMNPGIADYNVHAPPADELIAANAAHNLPQFHAIASSSTWSTPDVTDDSGASSPSTTSKPSDNRDHSEDSDPLQTPQPYAEMPTGKNMMCAWRQHFGGDCKQTSHQKQLLDRHLLTHLPDADGTVWYSYMCTECPRNTGPEGTQVGKKIKGKKEEGGFSRRDAGLRHVRTCHRDAIKNRKAKSLLSEVKWPWWWPTELFRTPRYNDKEKVGPRPLGETRDWEGYLRDVISQYPDVVNNPKGAKRRRGQVYRPY